jgi:hypothetical protein
VEQHLDLPRLSASDARAIIDELRETVERAVELIRTAYRGRAWEALGYDSWAALCAAEFRDLDLPRDRRRALVADLWADGMSTRAIGAAVSVDARSVRRDLREELGHSAPPERVTGTDGRTYPSLRVVRPEEPSRTIVVDAVVLEREAAPPMAAGPEITDADVLTRFVNLAIIFGRQCASASSYVERVDPAAAARLLVDMRSTVAAVNTLFEALGQRAME